MLKLIKKLHKTLVELFKDDSYAGDLDIFDYLYNKVMAEERCRYHRGDKHD